MREGLRCNEALRIRASDDTGSRRSVPEDSVAGVSEDCCIVARFGACTADIVFQPPFTGLTERADISVCDGRAVEGLSDLRSSWSAAFFKLEKPERL